MKKLIVAGAGILDVLVCPVDRDVFEKGSSPVDTIKISTGGDALNEATVLARIAQERGKITLLSVLGRDRAGEMILEHCQKEGISTEFVTVEKNLETGVNVVMVEKDGSRSFFTNPQSSLRKLSLEHFPEDFSMIPGNTEEICKEETRSADEKAGVFCLASMFVSSELGNREMAEIFARAKKADLYVCADMTKCKRQETAEDIREALGYLDYLFANEEEAALVTGETEPEKMADRLLDCGVKNAVIKCGARGCYVKNKELSRQFPAAVDAKCIDTTGAGDSFAAGFLWALSEGMALEKCVAWANTCGAMATEAVGACGGIADRAAVLARMCRSGYAGAGSGKTES